MFDKYFCRKLKRSNISINDIIEYSAVKYKGLAAVAIVLLALKCAVLLYPLYLDNALYTVVFIVISIIICTVLNLILNYISGRVIIAKCPNKKE